MDHDPATNTRQNYLEFTTDAGPLREYLEEGVRISVILLVWSVVAFAVGTLGDAPPLGLIELPVVGGLASVFWLTGVLNAVLYVAFRTVDRYRR